MLRTLFSPDLALGRVILGEDESRHGLGVLRLATGDAIRLVDGAGRSAEALVVGTGRRLQAEVVAIHIQPPPPASRLTVALATPKGSRFEDLVRGLTELGVGRIVPLATVRSVREPSLDRARRIAIEAIKQCGRADLPIIDPVWDLPTWLRQAETASLALFLADREGLAPDPGSPQDAALVVGPEGGWEAQEREQLLASGAMPVRLASPVLRIETAALAMTAIWTAAWEHHRR